MASLPFPTFDDIRKILNFWIDQQGKWFYFETATLKAASYSEGNKFSPFQSIPTTSYESSRESFNYIQDRIVGRISDVIPYPPSLLLQETSIFTVHLDVDQGTKRLVNVEERETYGLVFSQITYYEPIKNVEAFLQDDPRVSKQKKSKSGKSARTA